jgi:hypothetical protein
MCSVPLDFCLMLHDKHLEALYTYSKFKPISFANNMTYLKIIGLNQRKLCKRCFENKWCKTIPGPRDLRLRETTGSNKSILKGEYPLTQKDAYNWFKAFQEFSDRPNLELFLMQQNATFSIMGLIIVPWPS